VRNILHAIKRGKANWVGYILRINCFLKHGIEGKVERKLNVTIRRGRRRKQLLDNLKETRRYRALKGETLGGTVLITHIGRGYGPLLTRAT
jgi:hypothetical protein